MRVGVKGLIYSKQGMHRDEHIYMHTLQTSAYRTELQLKKEVLPSNYLQMSRNCQGHNVTSGKIGTVSKCFKQVQIAYLAAISYLDNLVRASYMLSTQIRPKAMPRASLGMLDTLTSEQ